MKKITLILICSIVLVSCGIEKRVHRSGFHMNKKTITHSAEKKTSEKRSPSPLTDIENIDVAENNTEFVIPLQINKSNSILSSNYDQVSLVKPQNNDDYLNSNVSTILNETCDLIILKDGSEIKSKVLEINDDNIKYKLCDNLDGPTFTKSKDLIFMIKYPNGTSTVINSTQPVDKPKNNNSDQDKIVPPSASWGLALSIIGWFVPFGSILILTIGGLLASHALKKIDGDPNKYGGRKMAKAAWIISLIGLIVWIIILLALILLYI